MKILFLSLILLPLLTACHRQAKLHSASPTEISKIGGTVYFDFNRWGLRDDQEDLLSERARFLREHKRVSVILEGHTDRIGPDEYNLELGDRRARKVKGELVAQGIEADRLVVLSFGKTRLREQDRTSKADRLNRRVEFHVK